MLLYIHIHTSYVCIMCDMYVCICVYMYTCIHVYVCIYTYMHIHIYILYIHVYTHYIACVVKDLAPPRAGDAGPPRPRGALQHAQGRSP